MCRVVTSAVVASDEREPGEDTARRAERRGRGKGRAWFLSLSLLGATHRLDTVLASECGLDALRAYPYMYMYLPPCGSCLAYYLTPALYMVLLA